MSSLKVEAVELNGQTIEPCCQGLAVADNLIAQNLRRGINAERAQAVEEAAKRRCKGGVFVAKDVDQPLSIFNERRLSIKVADTNAKRRFDLAIISSAHAFGDGATAKKEQAVLSWQVFS